MSFLSRRTSRPEQRGGRSDAGRQADSEYGDYDYAPGEYQQDDDNWSPDQYFSPEGIKGRWAAGARAAERSGGYGRDSYRQGSYGQDDGYGDEYGTGEYGTGGYETIDGPDNGRDDHDERGGGRRRRADRPDRPDRPDRGERRRRLGRRDKGDDIWPDDGVSDEDYWASVAADRPLNSTGSALDAEPMNVVNNRPMARPSGAARPAADSWSAADRPMAAESRFAGEPRTGSGRLGPAPGLTGSGAAAAAAAAEATAYIPRTAGTGSRPVVLGGTAGGGGANSGPMGRLGGGPNSGPMGRLGGPNSGPMPRAGMGQNSGPMPRVSGGNSGPMPRAGSASSGPMPRAGTGPTAAWPTAGSGTGPSPAWPANGHANARPAAGPAPARSATGPTPAWPGTGPAPARSGTGPAPARPAAGLAQPGLSHQPGLSGHSQPTVAQPALTPSFQPNTSRGSSRQPERPERPERPAAGYPDPRTSGRGHAPAPQNAPAAAAPPSVWGRDDSADARMPTGAHAVRHGGDDDPLTSRRYSREELMKTDGRSYSVASRRARITAEQYAAALTEQTQTFSVTGQYQADQQSATAGYPAGASSYPYPSQPYPSRPATAAPAAAEHDEDRYGQGHPARPRTPGTGYNSGYGNGSYGNNGYGNGRY